MSIAEVAIVKQKILFPGILLSLILLCPLCAQAAGAGGETAVPIWLCIPFAGASFVHCCHAPDQRGMVGDASAPCR